MMYGGFAEVYDGLMADFDYDRWADYYLALAKRAGVSPRRAADCACGTGSLTLALSRRGLQMTGLDISMEMLRVAGMKARAQGAQAPFVRQDMRKLLLHRPMDAVFAACDGVNYLQTEADVRAFFSAAYNALRPGGGLFFDCSSEYKLARLLGNRCLGNDGEKVSYIWQNHYDAPERLLQMDMTFFLRQEDGRYARFDETHIQRAHAPQEILRWLSEAGFAGARCFGGQTFTEPMETDDRIHFAAIKPEQEKE